ncbi:MAG: hypothetical protein IBJ10_07155 [Phycisphaerales bacterium]|nr:hypothetical protein [Phycisphaerales bacterium]
MSNANRHQRGAALAIAAVILALLGIVTVGVAGASGDDASLATQRLAGARAASAAESGRAVCLRQYILDRETPANGTFTLPDGSTFVVVRPFATWPSAPGEAIVEGRSASAVKRIVVPPPSEFAAGGLSDDDDDGEDEG